MVKKEKVYTYEGYLMFYQEMGEIKFPILLDSRGRNSKKTWDWTYVFGKNTSCNIAIYDFDGNEVFKGRWEFDFQNTLKNNCFDSPLRISPKRWMEYCLEGYKAVIKTNYPVPAECKKKKKNWIEPKIESN